MACKHNNVQSYTEICLDCGANIYETPEERIQRLQGQINHIKREALVKEGDALEAELDALRGTPDTNDSGW